MTTDPGANMIVTASQVRGLLADKRIFPELPQELRDDTELALDSMGLVWLFHLLEERYGLKAEPTDSEIAELTSIRRIVAYLEQTAGGVDEE